MIGVDYFVYIILNGKGSSNWLESTWVNCFFSFLTGQSNMFFFFVNKIFLFLYTKETKAWQGDSAYHKMPCFITILNI